MKLQLKQHILYAICATALFLACEKSPITEEKALIPPEPNPAFASLLVGSGIDSLPLESYPTEPTYGFEYLYAKNWITDWVCTKQPAGAPLPRIAGNLSTKAMATGLVLGDYTFEVSYKTSAGVKKKSMLVTVVPDKPAGTVVILENLNWVVEYSGIWGEGPLGASVKLFRDPDLFFFRGKSRMPKVEFLDPLTGLWIHVPSVPDNQAAYKGVVYFNFLNYDAFISLNDGIDEDWLTKSPKQPAVRLTY